MTITDSHGSPIALCADHLILAPSVTPQFFPSTLAAAAALETLVSFIVADAPADVVADIDLHASSADTISVSTGNRTVQTTDCSRLHPTRSGSWILPYTWDAGSIRPRAARSSCLRPGSMPATGRISVRPGSYVTFEIAGESLFTLRDREGTIRTFYNVCMHRGHRLLEGRGVPPQAGLSRTTPGPTAWTDAHRSCAARGGTSRVRSGRYLPHRGSDRGPMGLPLREPGRRCAPHGA